MARTVRHCLWVILAAGCVFFLNLGVPRLWDEDEPKNAACAREMLERHDWVVPMFNYELRTAKPVLTYWFMMTAYGMFGVSEFGARFWSAVLGIGTCLLTYGIGRRLFQPAVGLWAALMLAAALMFGVASRAATPDAPLIFFSTLSLAIFVWGLPKTALSASIAQGDTNSTPSHLVPAPMNRYAALRVHLPQSWLTYVAMYAAMAVAVLAKGPVGVALPTLILMGYLWCLDVMLRRAAREREAHAEQHSRGPGEAVGSPRPSTRGRGEIGSSLEPLGLAASNDARGSAGASPSQPIGSSLWRLTVDLLKELSPAAVWRVGWVLRPLTAIAMVAIIALPWYVWVGWRTDGEWIAGFLGKHNVNRFMQPLEGHSGPIFYYVIAVMMGFFPWSIFLPLACVKAVKRLRNAPSWTAGDLFCCSWAAIYIGFFSLASTKLPSYVLPAYPALALITARWVTEWLAAPHSTAIWLRRWGFINLAACGLIFVIGVPLATARLLPGTWSLGWAGLILVCGGIGAYLFSERQQFHRAAQSFGAASLVFTTCLFGIVAVQVNPHQTSASLMSGIFSQAPQPKIATFDYFEPSLAYYAGQPVRRLKTAEQATTFLQADPAAFLLIRDKDLSTFQQSLGSRVEVVERRRRFLKKDDILVLTASGDRPPALSVSVRPRAD